MLCKYVKVSKMHDYQDKNSIHITVIPKIVVITGSGSGEAGRRMEVVDMQDPTFKCSKTNFPINVYGASGGQIDDTILVCGGDAGGYSSACYSLEENGNWKYDGNASLNTARNYAATGSVIMNNSLVIAGGYRGSSLSSIELASPNTKSRTLDTNLYMNVYGACIVKWNETTVLVIGGYYSQGYYSYQKSRSETYFYNLFNNTRTPGPSMRTRRYHAACQEIVINGESFIIVVGGHGYNSPESTTEVLSKSAFKNGWKYGKNSKNGQLGMK